MSTQEFLNPLAALVDWFVGASYVSLAAAMRISAGEGNFSEVFIFHFFPYALRSLLSRSSQVRPGLMSTQEFLNPLAADLLFRAEGEALGRSSLNSSAGSSSPSPSSAPLPSSSPSPSSSGFSPSSPSPPSPSSSSLPSSTSGSSSSIIGSSSSGLDISARSISTSSSFLRCSYAYSLCVPVATRSRCLSSELQVSGRGRGDIVRG